MSAAFDDVAAIERCHDAFARWDTATIVGVQHEDVEWVIPATLPYGGTYRGRAGVLAFYDALRRTWEEYRIDLDRVVGMGDIVLSIGTFRGRAERPLEAPFVLVWEFDEGAVRRMRQYTDTAAVLDALGELTGQR